jgi:hypothetical protein
MAVDTMTINQHGRHPADAAPGQGHGATSAVPAKAGRLDAVKKRVGYPARLDDGAATGVDLERARRAVPLGVLLARYGLLSALKRSGSQLAGCCPIHDGSNPGQFIVNLSAGTWHCFGDCGRGGGTLELVALKERVSVRRAAALIAEWFALPPSPALQQRRHDMARPTHKVLAVSERGDGEQASKPFYTRIGSAWPIKDGKGLSIVLDALPVNARLILLEIDADEKEKVSEPKR